MPAGSIREIPTGAYFQDIFINISVKVLHPVARRVPEGGVHEKKMFKFWPLTRFFFKLLFLRKTPQVKIQAFFKEKIIGEHGCCY